MFLVGGGVVDFVNTLICVEDHVETYLFQIRNKYFSNFHRYVINTQQ